MSYYRVIFKDSAISHAESKSKYKGGFIMKNNRMNNSKAYNHDYYERNKNKWNKNKKGQQIGGFISTFFSVVVTTLAYAAAVVAVSAAAGAIINLYNKWKTRDIPTKPVSDPNGRSSTANKLWDKINKTFKYKYKITNSLTGKTRYFYTQAEYDKYLLGLSQKDRPYTISEDVYAVNPGIYEDKKNSDENCAYCTLAYDMRRRGYDVTALRENDPGFKNPTNSDIESWYKGGQLTSHHVSEETRRSGKVDTRSETQKFFDELASQGEGASGFVTACFRWNGGDAKSGHAMAYQVIDGEAYIIDTQHRRFMNADDFADSEYGKRIIWGLDSREAEDSIYGRDYCVNYMRTDNLQPDPSVVTKVKNVDGSSTTVRKDDERVTKFGESKPELVSKEEIEGKSK